MEALNQQAMRILRLFGNDDGPSACAPRSVRSRSTSWSTRTLYRQAPATCVFCGRTLFGAKPPKGQELDDHYFGAIKPARRGLYGGPRTRSSGSSGILAKTEHNEVAPAQHELAPIYTDHQHRHRPQPADHGDHAEGGRAPRTGLPAARKALCRRQRLRQAQQLVHLDRYRRRTCCSPGETPHENAQFLLFLVRGHSRPSDDYQDLLRCSVATAGNDHRLGAQRGAARRRLHLPRRRADRRSWTPSTTEQPYSGAEQTRDEASASTSCRSSFRGHDRPQPHLALRLHRQQVRVPHARLLATAIACAQHHAQRRRGASALKMLRRPAGAARRTSTAALHELLRQHDLRAQAHHLQRQRL